MGLGLHGGGSASAEFFARAGAQVTVTDLRDKDTLQPSIDALSEYKIRYVLGQHDIDDFSSADIVIKNPAVRPDSPYLTASARVETDISIFLSMNRRPVIAVTGSKGKSTIVSALYHVLKSVHPDTDLGGNITVSPLTFLNEKKNAGGSPVILELSSWQLADIQGRNLLKPCAAAITNIMHDHQDRYNSMADYAADKAVIFEAQTKDDILILNSDSDFTPAFAAAAPSSIFYVTVNGVNTNGASIARDGSGIWTENGISTRILGAVNTLKGSHNRQNLLTAAALLYKYGIDSELIIKGLAEFPGIAHRLEFIREVRGLHWYNDSAATIPEAAAAAVESFNGLVHLITGGTDKNLDFGVLADAARRAESISLLAGTGSDKIMRLFNTGNIAYDGPFSSLEDAVSNVCRRSQSSAGTKAAVPQTAVLSPGCASFGMFKNEFDRGDKFKALVNSL
ncbi:MAG: UDP-N-acetylmuramoyl-L-alanine--D-glutamate ligase [Spirochaetales bacterium]|nr:UDP-N-acetylmuramoyl-L-alanine--D-glutamate ligase [Spirochaetales bacterium]